MSDLAPPGATVDPAALATAKGQALARLLVSRQLPYFHFVETRRLHGLDVVVFEVEPEVPQHPAAPIQRLERVAAAFADDDSVTPLTFALRDDFPAVPHMNLVEAGTWPNLCLFDQPYSELKDQWTAAAYLRRVHQWLSFTSQGRLHQEDQALEPFLLTDSPVLIIPSDLVTEVARGPVSVRGFRTGGDPDVYVLIRAGAPDYAPAGANVRALACMCAPQLHGVIRRLPRSLEDLHELAQKAGADLRGVLRQKLRQWRDERLDQGAILIAILLVPLTRTAGGEVERVERWAVLLGPFGELGEKLGLWQVTGRDLAPLIPAEDLSGANVGIAMLRPMEALSREGAARLNGAAPDRRHVAAVGVGALGSQVVQNLARAGFGRWVLIDDDLLFPHNCARHALGPEYVGWSKAAAVAETLNRLYDDERVAEAIPANVLVESADLTHAFAEADIILDMSASVPAARAIALREDCPARRVSAFLNPNGSDLVVLAEGANRSERLDDLEMQYYRAVLNDDALAQHLAPEGKRIRYGQSCRDVTSDMPQHAVGSLAGIASAEVVRALASDEAMLVVWCSTNDSVVRHSVGVARTQVSEAAGWTIRADDGVIAKLQAMRTPKLPNETGGVLVGRHDLTRKTLYLVDALPAPPDSQEWPVAYIRGSKGLTAEIDRIQARSGNMVTYVGEWHSHPKTTPALPSGDDLQVALWIAEHMDVEELPAFMAIVGDDGPNWFVGQVVQRDPALAVALVQAASY